MIQKYSPKLLTDKGVKFSWEDLESEIWAMDKKYFDDRVGRECFCRRLGEIYQMIRKMDEMQPGWEYEYADSEHLKQPQVQSYDL